MTEMMPASATKVTRCLPVGEWPRLDRELWEGAQRVGEPLDEPRPASSWAHATRSAVAKAYGRWLTWLGVTGELDPLALPHARVTLERVRAYVVDLQAHNTSNTVHMRILQLGRMLEAMTPGSKPEWFGRVLKKLRAARQPARDDRARLVPARDLLALGWTLIKLAEQRAEWSPHRRALHHRDGLLILCLCACPLREGSLAILKTGQQLERRGDCWWVVLDRAEVKSHRPLEQPLPVAFTPAIERYLAHWRPMLLRRQTIYGDTAFVDSGHFWLSKSGEALRPKDFNGIVNAVTRRELGRALNPHLFRKLVATELAIRDPRHVGAAQAVLGHASYETTDAAYNLARALDAARQVHATLGAFRRGAVERRGSSGSSDRLRLEGEA